MIADLPVPDDKLIGAPLLPQQHTPDDFAHYIAARTSTWQSARNAGQAPVAQP